MFNKGKIYLDFASATPSDKRVLKIMSSYNQDFFANATSIHSSGVKVRNIIEKSRESIAKSINAHSDEIIFTGSSTESNAIAILGIVNKFKLNNNKIPHIITSEIEHPAVLLNCKMLEERGEAEVTYIKVNENGIVNPKDVKEAIKENTILVSIMYANNEIGTIQPIEDIAKEIRHFRKRGKEGKQNRFLGSSDEGGRGARPLKNDFVFPLFHSDATQAMNYLDTSNIEKLGVDMMSFNGSKIYGPKGIGALYVKRGVELSPIYSGGGQELGLRSGTENVASIAGFAFSLQITNKIKEKENARLIKLRDYATEKLLNIKVGDYKIILNGSKEARLPNNINISIEGMKSELLVIELDAKGIEVSSRSACKSGEENGSYVIKAIREAKSEAINEEDGSLRITLGRSTTKAHLDKLISILTKILEKYSRFK
jgi:cysteine desulfurase